MPQQREESIVDTVLAIWARRRFVAVVAFLTVLAGGLTVTLSLPAMYRSAASVLVQREELRDSLVRPGLTSELEARLRTIGQEALSRARLETLLERFDLYHTLRTRSTTEEAVEQLRRLAARFKTRCSAIIRSANLKNLRDESRRLRQIYNQAWEKNWGFVPFTTAEIEFMTREL